jgi:hypothetical protein
MDTFWAVAPVVPPLLPAAEGDDDDDDDDDELHPATVIPAASATAVTHVAGRRTIWRLMRPLLE